MDSAFLLHLLLELLRWLGKFTSDVRVFSVYRTHVSQNKMTRSRDVELSKSGDFESDANGFKCWLEAGSRCRD